MEVFPLELPKESESSPRLESIPLSRSSPVCGIVRLLAQGLEAAKLMYPSKAGKGRISTWVVGLVKMLGMSTFLGVDYQKEFKDHQI